MSAKPLFIKSITSTADYGALRNYYLYKARPKRTKSIAVLLLISFGFLLLAETEIPFPFFKALGIFGILVFAAAYFVIDHEGRMLDKSAKFMMNIRQELNLDEEGITVSWPEAGKQGEYLWSDLSPTVESDHHFFLFAEEKLPVIIAKFEMKESRINELRTFIKSHTTLVSDISGWKYEKI
ncbi:MAG: YcxB family protein [Eubacteriales bacterium]|nr:YcxB family protein [Eubacteriales bacterium]MDD3349343.1 YcxB family protein [Eubacteriales bacterium]